MASLFSAQPARPSALDALVTTIEQLLGESGCAWNKAQTHHSLAKYLIEETYELVDAIAEDEPAHVKEELGDVLFQIVLHAELAKRSGEGYDIESVAAAVDEKIRRRHPHVFGDEPTQDIDVIEHNWRTIKAKEKAERTSVLDGIPASLPALATADKVLGRARSLGLIGDGGGFPLTSDRDLGQLLLAVVASAAAAGLDAETALRATVVELSDEIRAAEAAMGDAGVVATPGE